MPFSPSFTMINTAGVAQSAVDLLQGLAAEALNLWGAALAGSATISVQIEITTAASAGRADGNWGNGVVVAAQGALSFAEGGAVFELHGNTPGADTGADIILRVDPTYLLNELFLDATPASRGETPIDRTDGLSVMLHEIGHALGFSGYYDDASNAYPGSFRTPYDSRMVLIGGEPHFDGPNVRAVYGGPVPLTDGSYSHYGNSSEYPGFTSNPLTGLMNGVVFYRGWNYAIGDLDLAFMADMGLGTTRNDILNVAYLGAMRGGLGDDSITGGSGDNLLQGDEGNDSIRGGSGNDAIHGGDGNDQLDGGTGADAMSGGNGDDIYYVDNAADGVDEVGHTGTDEVRASVNYVLGGDVENLRLSGSAVVGTGNALGNSIYAGIGPASLSGLGGDDMLYGSGSGDTLNGGDGNDAIYGRNGNDILNGDAGDDMLRGEIGSDMITGGTGNDSVFGGEGNDTVRGGAGDDVLRGEAQTDTLYGEDGADVLTGGDGYDSLYGGAGRDVMQGGAQNDNFWFLDGDFAGLTNNTADRIQDFQAGIDHIRLNLVDANTLVAGDQAFAFIGTAAFGQVAGQLRYVQSSGVTLIQGDTNGDGAADFAIALTGLITLVRGDFVL